MSYTNDDIKARAELLCGGSLSEDSEKILGAVCAAADEELKARLRRGVEADKLGELFVTASGMLALSLCMELENYRTEGMSSFRAGELSVSFGRAGMSADALRNAAEALLSVYLEGEGFGFMGVPG